MRNSLNSDRWILSLKNCPIADICQMYDTGDNKPHNHDVRNKIPCKAFLDFSCILSITIQQEAMGLTIACDLDKIKRLRKA